jgi:hypothetical protein
MSVTASNDINELTTYPNSGFLSPGPDEDNKPDLMAPGGSNFQSQILSVDSNDADADITGLRGSVRQRLPEPGAEPRCRRLSWPGRRAW